MTSAVRVRISSSLDVADDLRTDVPEESTLGGVWLEDDDKARSLEPGVVGFIIENLIALLSPLVAYLALRATRANTPITAEIPSKGIIVTLRPGMSEAEQLAVIRQLAGDAATESEDEEAQR